jgi:hypothetical protein
VPLCTGAEVPPAAAPSRWTRRMNASVGGPSRLHRRRPRARLTAIRYQHAPAHSRCAPSRRSIRIGGSNAKRWSGQSNYCSPSSLQHCAPPVRSLVSCRRVELRDKCLHAGSSLEAVRWFTQKEMTVTTRSGRACATASPAWSQKTRKRRVQELMVYEQQPGEQLSTSALCSACGKDVSASPPPNTPLTQATQAPTTLRRAQHL